MMPEITLVIHHIVLIQVPINKRKWVCNASTNHSLPPLRTDRSDADSLLSLAYAVLKCHCQTSEVRTGEERVSSTQASVIELQQAI